VEGVDSPAAEVVVAAVEAGNRRHCPYILQNDFTGQMS